MSQGSLLTEWSRLLLGSLRAAGVRDAVISPGSRSTPFAWAALRTDGLACRSVIDERSAAFYAVGHARMTGRPVLLICTSGSAAANYFPAVVEAAEANVPLLVLTADRPLELQQAAAPQTIDQVKLYGDYVRGYFELGTPDPDPRMLRSVPRIAARAVLASLYPAPGPVQLNARARKPLEPTASSVNDSVGGAADDAIARTVDVLLDGVRPTPHPGTTPDGGAVETLAGAVRSARRGLIVCGPALPRDAASAAAVTALARATGYPVVAETASQLRFGGGPRPPVELDAFAALLEIEGFAEAHAPEVVIQVGRPPTASAWNGAIESWPNAARWVVAPAPWPDPWGGARLLLAPPAAGLDAVREALPGRGDTDPRKADTDWVNALVAANDTAWRVTDASLRTGFPEGAAVRTLVESLPRGSVLAVGNSLPIREVDRFVRAGDRGLSAWFQRGANGIDGLVSGAAGATSATGRPTLLIVGDVSFLHDLGGLAAVRELPAPLTVAVLNNGGGRIFERLPLADRLDGDPLFDAWRTPPDLDMEAAARAFGIGYERATDAGSLNAALDPRNATPAARVVEVVVPEGGTTGHQRELRRRLAEELGG